MLQYWPLLTLLMLLHCRYLEEHHLAVQRGQPGCIDCLELFAPHVRSWITNSQETLCATCRSLEATTELSSMASAATQVSSCAQHNAVASGKWAQQVTLRVC
jgi:hypothetical protein